MTFFFSSLLRRVLTAAISTVNPFPASARDAQARATLQPASALLRLLR
jgi:hypothetical protein